MVLLVFLLFAVLGVEPGQCSHWALSCIPTSGFKILGLWILILHFFSKLINTKKHQQVYQLCNSKGVVHINDVIVSSAIVMIRK